MILNLGYQGTQNFNLQMGQQLRRNSNSNADELLLRVTKMMKNQFGLKPKGQTFSYKCPYLEWYDWLLFLQIIGFWNLLSSLVKIVRVQ